MDNKIIVIAVVAIVVVAAVGIYLVTNDGSDEEDRALLGNALEVYGNADGDWDIDADDIEAIRAIINGEAEETEFADANYDGVIDEADIEQVQAIIDGTADELCLLDGLGEFKRVGTDPQRLAVDQIQICEFTKIMGVGDRVVCGDFPASILAEFYFDQEVITYGSNSSPDYEVIASNDIDMYLTFYTSAYEEKATMLPDTDVIYLGLYVTDTLDLENSDFVQGFLKGGYIFNNVERAEAYIEWLLGVRDTILEVTSTIADEDKKTVLISNYANSYWSDPDTLTFSNYLDADTLGQAAILAGARLASEDYPDYGTGSLSFTSNVEWLVDKEIDFLFLHTVRLQGNGTEVLIVPEQGYLVDNRDEFVECQNSVAQREYAQMVGLNEDNIYMLAGDFRNNASSGILLAAYMCKILYPELFEDFDPYEIHNEYMEWMGFPDYDTAVQGTFIVPPY